MRQIVDGLANLLASRQDEMQRKSEVLADMSLRAEHEKSVADALAKGNIRKNVPRKPLATQPKLAREFRIEAKSDGSFALVVGNGEQVLTVALAPQGIHAVLSVFLNVSTVAGWDFPPISELLETSRSRQAAVKEKVVH